MISFTYDLCLLYKIDLKDDQKTDFKSSNVTDMQIDDTLQLINQIFAVLEKKRSNQQKS
jgi:hypothetical protein